MSNLMGLAKLILDLGPVAFYEHQEDGRLFAPPLSRFYWKHVSSPQVYGPYESLFAATKSYEEYVNLERLKQQRAASAPQNVVYVDFRTKKRLTK